MKTVSSNARSTVRRLTLDGRLAPTGRSAGSSGFVLDQAGSVGASGAKEEALRVHVGDSELVAGLARLLRARERLRGDPGRRGRDRGLVARLLRERGTQRDRGQARSLSSDAGTPAADARRSPTSAAAGRRRAPPAAPGRGSCRSCPGRSGRLPPRTTDHFLRSIPISFDSSSGVRWFAICSSLRRNYKPCRAIAPTGQPTYLLWCPAGIRGPASPTIHHLQQ